MNGRTCLTGAEGCDTSSSTCGLETVHVYVLAIGDGLAMADRGLARGCCMLGLIRWAAETEVRCRVGNVRRLPLRRVEDVRCGAHDALDVQ